jgi:excisionase family DNA binding protein
VPAKFVGRKLVYQLALAPIRSPFSQTSNQTTQEVCVSSSMRAMNIEEICERLNLCAITVYKLFQSGQLPARKVNGRWFCTEQAVEQFLKPQAVAALVK